MTSAETTRQLVDHLFRTRAGEMVAWLTRAFGSAHLNLAEEVVEDALIKALQQWPFSGIPDNPSGWLYRVARDQAPGVPVQCPGAAIPRPPPRPTDVPLIWSTGAGLQRISDRRALHRRGAGAPDRRFAPRFVL